jgi:hypothetical protein
MHCCTSNFGTCTARRNRHKPLLLMESASDGHFVKGLLAEVLGDMHFGKDKFLPRLGGRTRDNRQLFQGSRGTEARLEVCE